MKYFILLLVVVFTFHSQVKANDLPPLASFVDDVNRGFFFAGETVTFDGSGSIDQDEGGSSITRYRWKVDGVTMQESSSPTFSTSFSLTSGQNSKTVQIILEVRDDELTWTTHEDKMTKTYTVRRGQDRHFYIKDHLGSVRVTVDEAGDPIGFDDYYPYGLQMPTRSSNTSNPNDAYKYTGHERDTEAGLTFDYMGARTYDPMLGTFMQIDPLMEFATPYSYVGDNPVNLTDPTGMSSCEGRHAASTFESVTDYMYNCGGLGESSVEIEKQEKEGQSIRYNTEYGIRIDDRFFSEKITFQDYMTRKLNPREEQMYRMQELVRNHGDKLKAVFGPDGSFSNTPLTFIFEAYPGGEENGGQFTFGHKNSPVQNLWTGGGSSPRTVDFGPSDLQMVLYVNPNEYSNFIDGTPAHELRHALYTLAGVAFGDRIETGGWQHAMMYRSPLTTTATERIDLAHYLIALSQVK